MVIAIEPMLTLGSPDIYVDSNDWTVITDDGMVIDISVKLVVFT